MAWEAEKDAAHLPYPDRRPPRAEHRSGQLPREPDEERGAEPDGDRDERGAFAERPARRAG